MKKYFCTSDIHSYYTPLKIALDESGFDINNKDHILVVLGDCLDRGSETLEVYNFIKSIPQDRRILIRGNHELLYLELLEKDEPSRYDFSNGTVRTFCTIAGAQEFSIYDLVCDDGSFGYPAGTYHRLWRQIVKKVKQHEITKFIKSNEWKTYFELNNYIFVHSFIPLRIKDIPETKWIRGCKIATFNADPDDIEPVPSWRSKATKKQWYDATWGCPFKLYEAGLFNRELKRGKTLVVGHWHTSDAFEFFNVAAENIDDCPIFIGKDYNCGADNLVCIDACTAYTDRTNIFIVETED